MTAIPSVQPVTTQALSRRRPSCAAVKRGWRPPKTTYKTTNWQSYNQAVRQRGSLTVWFDPSMQWEAIPSGRRDRQQAYSDAAIQACLTLKILLGLPLRHIEPWERHWSE